MLLPRLLADRTLTRVAIILLLTGLSTFLAYALVSQATAQFVARTGCLFAMGFCVGALSADFLTRWRRR